MEIEFRNVILEDKVVINQISEWYHDQWDIFKENAVDGLKEIPDDTVIFQMLMSKEL